ncbi:protein tyrosine phosphatase [Rhizobium sp. 58]|nr:protein tyrosine phosphatase [Rhizobium sp. 58]
MKSACRLLLRTSALYVLAAGVCFGGYLGFLQLTGNFHTVVRGELYRSAQPSAAQLKDYVGRYGIKTVINLRGPENLADWYKAEVSTTQRLGVMHVDFALSSSRMVSEETADVLLQIMKDAPKPILIHCKAGADRSGIASALYSYRIARIRAETSEEQLSVFFGHIGIPHLSPAFAMDKSWEALEDEAPKSG